MKAPLLCPLLNDPDFNQSPIDNRLRQLIDYVQGNEFAPSESDNAEIILSLLMVTQKFMNASDSHFKTMRNGLSFVGSGSFPNTITDLLPSIKSSNNEDVKAYTAVCQNYFEERMRTLKAKNSSDDPHHQDNPTPPTSPSLDKRRY